jgi:hypothetical protein
MPSSRPSRRMGRSGDDVGHEPGGARISRREFLGGAEGVVTCVPEDFDAEGPHGHCCGDETERKYADGAVGEFVIEKAQHAVDRVRVVVEIVGNLRRIGAAVPAHQSL